MENGANTQQMDDLFDILLKSGGDESSNHDKGVKLLLRLALLQVLFGFFQKSQA